MTTKVLELNNIERILFWALASCLGLAIAFYLYSVISMTVSVVGRDQALTQARSLSGVASELEESYVGLQNSVTMARAQELGFSEVAPKFTQTAPTTLAVLR